eukprot:7299742-Prymnesium_polylepis.1
MGWQHLSHAVCAHGQPLSWDGGIWGVARPGGRTTVDHPVCGGACTRVSAFAMHAQERSRWGQRTLFDTRAHVFRPLPDAPPHRRFAPDGPRTQHYCSSNLPPPDAPDTVV